MECHSKYKVAPMEFHSKLIIPQNGVLLKMECPSIWNVTQNSMTQNRFSLKMEHHSKWSVTQNEISFKMEYHSK